MNNVLTEQADAGYRLAEQKASQYFTSLRQQLMENTYTTALTQDIHVWQKNIFIVLPGFLFCHQANENPIPGMFIDISTG